jgi:cellulose synthase operon protein C
MRRSLAALFLVLASTGCAPAYQGYRDLTPDPAPALAQGGASAEADALIASFYGKGGADLRPAIAAALARAPRRAGLHEIAAYDAVLRGAQHEAFNHFAMAAADRDAATPDLYLWEMRSLASTAGERLTAAALLRAIAGEHPAAPVRDLASYYLGRDLCLFANYDEAAAASARLGFIETWSVVGSFDNDQGKGLATEYPPELPSDTHGEYMGSRVPVRFRPARASRDGALPLAELVWPSESAVAYAETWITSPRAREIDLRLTTSSDVRVWLDGRSIADGERISREDLDNLTFRVALPAGAHRLLVKSAHGTGPWRLAARFTEPGGGPAADLAFSATSTGPASAERAKVLLSGPGFGLESIADPHRRTFLLARLAVKQGRGRKAPELLDRFLADAPGNPAAMLFTANARRDAGEAGKAIDLLGAGAAAYSRLPSFLIERGRFYAQRKVFDKASKDLEAALAESADARRAALELASVYGAQGWQIERCRRLDAALLKWPDSVEALVDLSGCKDERGYAHDAEDALRRARALTPGDAFVLRRLMQLALRRVDLDEALARAGELRKAAPDSLDALLDEADVLRRAGRADEARSLMDQARAQSPDAPRTYVDMASLAWETGHLAEAGKLYRQALDRDPDDAGIADRAAALDPDGAPLGDKLAPTTDDIDKAVRSADGVTVHAGSAYVILLDDEVTTVNVDGSSRRIVTFVAKAVNTEGRDALIQAKLPSRGKVRVLDAYSIRKDGERQDASSVGGGTIRYRSLDVGSIVVRKYVHYAPAPPFLPNAYASQRFGFQAVNAQTERSRWCLVLDAGRSLVKFVRGDVEAKSEKVGDRRVWTFSAHAAPPLVPEIDMPTPEDTLWTVAVSTAPDWAGYARWEQALLTDAFPVSEDLDKRARAITAGAPTPRAKLERLWSWVAQEIRYQQEYEDTIAGVKPHPATVVVERGYGDCKDKAVLLIRLARTVGLDLRFALLRTKPHGEVLRDVPSQQFNHAIAYVPKQAGIDEPFFVDTTTNGLDIGNLRADDQGALSLVLEPKTGGFEIVPIPYQAPEMEAIDQVVAIDLADPAKARAVDQIHARGTTASGLRRALRSGEGAKKVYQSIAEELFAGTTLRDGTADEAQSLDHPLSIRLDIDLAGVVQSEGDRWRIDLPFPFPPAKAIALTTRALPLVLTRGVRKLQIVADLPEGQVVDHAPADLDVEHGCFSIHRKTRVEGRKVTVSTDYACSCARVEPVDYAAFRAAVQKASVRSRESLVFGPKEKGKKAGR